MTRIVCFGECMIELSRTSAGEARVGFGGDTLNTAMYLSRLGQDVAFMTAVGDDAWSADLKSAWVNGGIDVSLVATHPTRTVGIYAISTDDHGERSFVYWRDQSAARAFFQIEATRSLFDKVIGASLFYLSGISLAILDREGRNSLIDLARQVRLSGGQVVFDPNYRPRLWVSSQEAQAAILALSPFVSIAMPSFDDEALLWGDSEPGATAARWKELGVPEIVVKNGAHGAWTQDGTIQGPKISHPVDTTGAGDSFNAGYLAARLNGASADQAAHAGAKLASIVVQHPGAVIHAHNMPSLEKA